LSCECGTSEQARRSLLHLEALLQPAETVSFRAATVRERLDA
jgi:hypothetical protein